MKCGLAIATAAGLHLRCILPDGHEGSCLPELPFSSFGGARPRPIPIHWAAAREPEFLGNLLAIVEAAGQTLSYLDALNIARALCRARLGIPERRS
jgi:hypothetical protein